MTENLSAEEAGGVRPGLRLAAWLEGGARWSLWLIAFFVMVVVPWFFGGMGPEGYWFTVWSGWACLVPLGLWVVSSILLRRRPPAGFWVAVVCWGLLALQVFISMGNKCQAPQAPWVGSGFDPVEYNHWLPTTVFRGGTEYLAKVFLSYVLLALSSYAVGLRRSQWKLLLWIFFVNVTVLAAVGIPYKYSGNYLMLGRWEMNENYFFSTFIYHNHWCAFALLAVAVGVGLCAEFRALWTRGLIVFLLAVIAVSAPISVSRLGTLIIMLFLGFVAVWCFVRRYKAGKAAFRRGVLLSVTLLGVMGALGAGALWLNRHGPGSVGQRTWGYILHQNPFNSRIMLVEDAAPMVYERSVFGWGLGGFGLAFRDYQRPETIILYNQGRETRYEHCHNDWMERLVELGFIGCLLFVFPVWYWYRQRGGVLADGLRFWPFAGLVALWLFALGDMAFDNRCVALVTACFVGLVFRRTEGVNQGIPEV